MKRIQRGPVRGISFKLQEEERERKDQYVPEVSALAVEEIQVDSETMAMIKSLNFDGLAGVVEVGAQGGAVTGAAQGGHKNRGPRRKEVTA